MAEAQQKALTGAAQGAAAGASFGPWGALIGGVAGGAMGYMQGDDPTAPGYVPGAPPTMPGGTSGPFGGTYVDTKTGSTQNLYNNFDPNQMGNNIQSQSLYNQLMGQGNGGITNNLDFQSKDLMQKLARLKAQQTGSGGIGGGKTLADMLGGGNAKYFVDKDGNAIDPTDRNALNNNKALHDAFIAQTGGNYGQSALKRGLGGVALVGTHGNAPDAYYRWAQDAYKAAGADAKIGAYKQAQSVEAGNQDQRNQAMQSLQNQLDYVNQAKTQMGSTGGTGGPGASSNPLLNFLNQRNNGQTYTPKDYTDPWTAKMGDEAQYYLDKSHQSYDPTTGKTAQQLGVPDAAALNAKMQGQFNSTSSQLGGTMMQGIGAYDGSKAGDFISALNRNAQKSLVSDQALAQEQAARRGVLGGSAGESSRLANEQSLQDSMAQNASHGYEMDQNDRQNWFNRKFAVDSHNSDVARLGAQARTSGLNALLQGGFNNEMTSADFYNKLKQQGFTNNQSEQQRLHGDMLNSLGQRTALGQNSINNSRFDQNREDTLNQQNFSDRVGLMGQLQGQMQQGKQNQYSEIGINNQQAGLGNNMAQWLGNNNNEYNASLAAGQNAQNMARFQQQINDQARQQAAYGQVAQGIGAAAGRRGGQGSSQTAPQTTAQGGIPGGTSSSLFNGASTTDPAIPGGTNLQFGGMPTWNDYSQPQGK